MFRRDRVRPAISQPAPCPRLPARPARPFHAAEVTLNAACLSRLSHRTNLAGWGASAPVSPSGGVIFLLPPGRVGLCGRMFHTQLQLLGRLQVHYSLSVTLARSGLHAQPLKYTHHHISIHFSSPRVFRIALISPSPQTAIFILPIMDFSHVAAAVARPTPG